MATNDDGSPGANGSSSAPAQSAWVAGSPADLFDFVFNAITEPVSVIDDTLTYRLVNDAWCSFTGRSRGAAIGRSVNHVFPVPTSPERRRALHDCLARGTAVVVRGPGTADHHPDVVLETRFFPCVEREQGQRRGAVVITRDISAIVTGQTALSESLDNLRLTLNATGDAIFATDAPDMKAPVMFANDRMFRLWGIPAELAGRLNGELILEYARPLFVDPDREVARIAEIVASGAVHEDRVVLRDGRVLVRRCVPTERDGRAVRVWGFRDVTEQDRAERRLQASEVRYRALLAAFPGYISALDPELNCLYINERLAAHFGSTPQQLIGVGAAAIIDPDKVPTLASAVQAALAGEVVTLERLMEPRGDEPRKTVLATYARGETADGRPVVFSFGTDITSLKRTEAALTAARDEAERASRAKSQFLSNMSHELRTPLNAVLGFAQVLELNPAGNLNADQQRQLREIRKAGEHLLSLIDDLLDLTQVEAGRIEVQLEPLALEPLIHECLQLVRPQADLAAVRLEAPLFVPAPRAQADPRRLRQVLINLLTNAVKYNRPGGLVSVRCQERADALRIEVRDTGPGLDADQCARVFRPFERLGAQRSAIPGAGIGLALSHQLVQLMSGQLGVDSQPGAGSCFWVQLALAAPTGGRGG